MSPIEESKPVQKSAPEPAVRLRHPLAGLGERVRRYGLWRTFLFLTWWKMPAAGRRAMERYLANWFKSRDGKAAAVKVNGTTLHADLTSPWAARVYYILGRYDEDPMTLVRRAVPPDYTFVDVGANFGAWTFSLCPHFRSVVAVEPHPGCFHALEKTRDLLGTANVRLVNAALAQKEGEGALHLTEYAVGDDRIYNPGDRGRENSVPIKLMTFDSMAAACGVQTERLFVKLDAQGAEPWIFQGMDRLIEGAKDIIIYMEVQRNILSEIGMTAEDFFMDLKARGFEPVDLTGGLNRLRWDTVIDALDRRQQNFCFRYRAAARAESVGEPELAGQV